MLKPRVVVFGSTKDEIHIGCKALSDGLENLIQDKIDKDVIIQNVSHKFLSPIFYKNLVDVQVNKKRKYKIISFNEYEIHLKNSFDGWMKAYNELKNDVYLKLTILNSDIVIVNVEGIVHHKAVFGHQLLAIGKMATDLGKEVYWVNFSVQSENDKILKFALEGSRKISAREIKSFNYLKSLDLEVDQSFDTAIMANFDLSSELNKKNESFEFCLFTGSNVKNINLIQIASAIKEIGLEPVYLPMGLNDYDDLKIIKANSIKHYDFGNINYSDIIRLIEKSKFVLSGRHHLNVFCAKAAKPFIPFKSNTWKVEGVCEMLDIEVDFDESLEVRIHKTVEQYSTITSKLNQKRQELMILASKNI